MTINNGALNTADFNTATYHLTRLLIPRDKNPLYGTLQTMLFVDLATMVSIFMQLIAGKL